MNDGGPAFPVKHTPGPWEVVVVGNGEVLIEREKGHALSLGFLVSKADARLIAAAPELLEALQEAVNELEFLYSVHETVDKKLQSQDALVLKRLQAAIAKAMGEG